MQHPEKTRLVLTRTEDDGTSNYEERVVESVTEYDADGNPLFVGSLLWGTADGISTVGPGQNHEQVSDPFYGGPGAVRFVFFTFLPKSEGVGEIDRYKAEDADEAETEMPGLSDAFDADRPGMHITDTVDFVHVLSGEMVMQLDRGETVVRAGDVFIMRGGWHAWRNESDQPCTVASVLVGANRVESP